MVRSIFVCLITIIIYCGTPARCGETAKLGQTSSPTRARALGIVVGAMKPGSWNSITDVPGVRVGHKTLFRGTDVRTGVTAVLPHGGNLFQEKVPAAVMVGNGFGKLAGSTQIEELGNIETPIVLTNTLSVGTAVQAVVRFMLGRPGNEDVHSVNAVVGETNDGYLNDIRGLHVTEQDVVEAIEAAATGPVGEGSVGAGTGTIAFWFKGGIGTSSRVVAASDNTAYTVGVLVQSNFGGLLVINGAPVWTELQPPPRTQQKGSCMIVVATDAPLSPRNLKRLARRALLGLARTGSYMSNGSGDYVIAFSTAYHIPYHPDELLPVPPLVANDAMSPLFQAVVEATEESVYNSMFMATTITGRKGRTIHAIPIDQAVDICRKYGAITP
jgi:D-aminopeptidase